MLFSVVRMSRTEVAAASNIGAPASPSRSARSRTCPAASSPLIYTACAPELASLAAVCSSSVDFPIPGSPPMRIALPGTMPPPSARSNSAMPETRRFNGGVLASSASNTTARPPVERSCLLENTVAGTSSVSVFHSPQSTHCPCQR